MTYRALIALALALVTACAAPGSSKRSQADQDRDGKTIAGAIESADQSGSSFHMTLTLTFTGGDIPSGQMAQIKATADGVTRDSRLRMTYRINAAKNRSITYDMVVVDTWLYARLHGAPAWKRTSAASVGVLFPAVRLPLVRESVLLAKEVDASSVTNAASGFAHRYRVVPAADQLQQLQAIPIVGGQQETLFLKTASAEIDAYLALSGDKLNQLDIHLTGTDPSNGETQKIDTTAEFKGAKVSGIDAPTPVTTVTPDQILNGQ